MANEHEPGQDAAALAEAAGRVSGSAEVLARQIAALRTELQAAQDAAKEDVEAARRKATAEVEAERKDRRWAMWKFALVILIDVVLSGVSLGLYADQRATEDQLHKTQVAVLCPLYKLFVQAVQAPRVGETPQQEAARKAAQAPIRDGYIKLGCTPALPSK